jgi:DNA-binding FadR family transcriptional regulator
MMSELGRTVRLPLRYDAPVAVDPSDTFARPARATRAYEDLAAQLRQRILSGQLPEGVRIPPEAVLAREAQVSRSTVREALRTLQESGFLERSSPKVLVVRRPTDEGAHRELRRALRGGSVSFHNLYEALLILEPELTRLATQRATPEGIEALERNLREQAASFDDLDEWSRLDQEFHLTIADMSDNPALALARAPISELLMPVLRPFMTSRKLAERALEFHDRILEEIRGGDPEAAAMMTRKHINDFRIGWERSDHPDMA